MDNEKLSGLSMDIEAADREKLRAVFPQCFVEGKLDIDKLLNLCGEYITDDFEKYEFKWKGKSECFQLAGKRSVGTLRPCPEESVDWENTKNLYIEGDNLGVLKLLQTSYYRKVKMIYIEIITSSLIQSDVSFRREPKRVQVREKGCIIALKGCNVKRYEKSPAMAA